jgi:hypothetical protein
MDSIGSLASVIQLALNVITLLDKNARTVNTVGTAVSEVEKSRLTVMRLVRCLERLHSLAFDASLTTSDLTVNEMIEICNILRDYSTLLNDYDNIGSKLRRLWNSQQNDRLLALRNRLDLRVENLEDMERNIKLSIGARLKTVYAT